MAESTENNTRTEYTFEDEGSVEDPNYNPDSEPPQTDDDDIDNLEEEINETDNNLQTSLNQPARTFAQFPSQSQSSPNGRTQQPTSLLNLPAQSLLLLDSQSAIPNNNTEHKQSQDTDIRMRPPPSALAASQHNILQQISQFAGTNVNASELSDIHAAHPAGLSILSNVQNTNNGHTGNTTDNISSSSGSESTENNSDSDNSDNDHMNEDNYALDNLCLPPPFEEIMELYLREGLFRDTQHLGTAQTLLRSSQKLRERYESDKRKYTQAQNNVTHLKWEQWYASYWPKISSYSSNKVSSDGNGEELQKDLLSLEAFRYELNDISSIINTTFSIQTDANDGTMTHFMNYHMPKLQYLVKYALNSIGKIQEHCRFSGPRAISVSWAVVVWLSSTVDFCARHLCKDKLTHLCIPLLKVTINCFEFIGRSGPCNDSMNNSVYFDQNACKHAYRYIQAACKMEYHRIKQRYQTQRNRMHSQSNNKSFKPAKIPFDAYLFHVLQRGSCDPSGGEIKNTLRDLMNSLKYDMEVFCEKENMDCNNVNVNGVSMDNRCGSVCSQVSGANGFKLPFPWDSAKNLTQFLYVIERVANYYVGCSRQHKAWIDKMIDAFYINITSFPTEYIRVLNDIDPAYYSSYSSQRYATNSFNHIMSTFNKLVCALYDDHSMDFEYMGEECDMLHDGNRLIDITFLSVYMKQIGNSNVETQLRGLNKIYDIMKKVQHNQHSHRSHRRFSNGDSPYDDSSNCDKRYSNNYNYLQHKWLSEPKLADYLTQKEFIKLLFERDSHNKILERCVGIIDFLARERKINRNDLKSIWSRCQHKHESQIDAYHKIIKTLSVSLHSSNVKFLLQIVTDTRKQEWNKDYVHLLYTITRYAAHRRFKRRSSQPKRENTNVKKENYWFALPELWNISLDDSFKNGLQQQAQQFVVELLHYECFKGQIRHYLMQCVQYLKQHKHIVMALKFFKTISIGHIFGNQYVKTSIDQQNNSELLKTIATSNNLLELVFADLRRDFSSEQLMSVSQSNRNNGNGSDLQHMIEAQFNIAAKRDSLQERLLFIDFLLRFADGKVEQKQVKELWEMAVCNPNFGKDLKGHGLDFFASAIDPRKQEKHFFDAFMGLGQSQLNELPREPYNAAFTDEMTHYVGNHLCNTLDTKHMTLKHFNLRKAYFYRIGVLDKIFALQGTHYYLIDCNRLDIDWLWNIVFDAMDCNVSRAAQLLIKDIYTLIDCQHGTIDISQLYEIFVAKCMTRAQLATRPSTPNDTDIPMVNSAPNTNTMDILSSLLNGNGNGNIICGNNAEQTNRRTIKRCFSLLRMAIDNFGGKRHGNMVNIEVIFVEVSTSKERKTPNMEDKTSIAMGELQTCRELTARASQEVHKRCENKRFNIRGLIRCGKHIPSDDTTLTDAFESVLQTQIRVVYTTSDIPINPERQMHINEQKTQAIMGSNNVPPPMQIKPKLHRERTLDLNDTSAECRNGSLDQKDCNTPDSNPNASTSVDVDIEAMSHDASIIEQQKKMLSNCSSVNLHAVSDREHVPSPPPPSVKHQLTNGNGQYPTTPKPTRKPPCFTGNANQNGPQMCKINGSAINKKSGYSDFMTGGLTRVDSMVSVVDVSGVNSNSKQYEVALHPSDILSKSKYFNQLFGFLAYPHDIACEAWEILRKLPLNRDKKLCVKDFNNGWNGMFDLKTHKSVLMARYGLDILSKLMKNDAKMYNNEALMTGNDDTKQNKNECAQPRWIVRFIRRHGLVLILQLLISIDAQLLISIDLFNNPEISCASMVIHFLADMLQIENKPTSIASEILNDKQTSDLFLSPQVLSSIMKIIGVLSSFTEQSNNSNTTIIGPQFPPMIGDNTAFVNNNAANPMKFSTEVLKLCFVVLKFILQSDKSHNLIKYFLSSDLRQWVYRLLIHSSSATLRLMVKSQLQLLYGDHFQMGQKLCDKGSEYNLHALDKLAQYSQDPRLVVGIVKACLEILGILPVESDTNGNNSVSLQHQDRFRSHEFMVFLHDCIRDLVCSFDVLSKYPKYKTLLIQDCNNYNGIDWYEILDKFMAYFNAYQVTESQLTSPDPVKLLPIKISVYSTHFRVQNPDIDSDQLYADKCLIGTLKIIQTLIETLSKSIDKEKLENNSNKLIDLVNNVFQRGLFPDIDTIWKQRRGIYQLPLCKQKQTRDTAMNLLVAIARCTCARTQIQNLMIQHHSATNRLRKYLNFDDWNYLHNILSRSFNGNVGLVNLGATCYMNSLMQQLFANPQFRFSILSRNIGQIRQTQKEKKYELITAKKQELRSQRQQQMIQNGQEYKEEKDFEEYKDENVWKMIVESNSNTPIGDKDDENCDMLNELQNIFTYLQESDLRSYDPQSFCMAYKQPGGRPMELRVQMDVDEFFNIFTDKLEKQLQFDAHSNIIQYLFGGVFTTQMIGKKECKHYREKSDPFVTLTLDVKSKNNIVNSLNSYVQGEVISDYQCDKCNKRIEILKRSCIRILPRNLVIHLKRFDFDIETLGRAKVNEALQFEAYLDMSAFTKDGLENKEQTVYKVDDNDLTEEEKRDRELNEQKFSETYDFESSTMYRLVGIINHSGGTESGHYTSYIREHNDNGVNHNGVPSEMSHKWSFANDRIVEDWDCKKIPEDCFGGPLANNYMHTTTTTVTNNTQSGNVNGQNNSNGPSNKMYSAYMLFYERVSVEESRVINTEMQNGALSKSYYHLSDVLKNSVTSSVSQSVPAQNVVRNKKGGKLSGNKRQQREFDSVDGNEISEPPQKRQKISHKNGSETEPKTETDCGEISRDFLIRSAPNQLPKYLSKEQQSLILSGEKKERVWNENKAAMIERQILEKSYIQTCVKTVLLSVPKSDSGNDANELMNASKFVCTLLYETIGHCKNLSQIISRKDRNDMCKILAASPLGCKWFLKKLLATNDNHWLRALYDPKLNRIYGETLGEIVRDLVLTALKVVREEECKYYKNTLRAINDNDTDIGMNEKKEDTMDIDDANTDVSNHLIVKLIKALISQFPDIDKCEYAHPVFEILMHFAHFGHEERVLLINLGMIWKGIAYYRRDFNGLRNGAPTKNVEKSSSNSSSASKLGWPRKKLKETQCLKALPQIISTLITSIHPEYLETFFHEQQYSDNKNPEKAVAEDWLHSKCLSCDIANKDSISISPILPMSVDETDVSAESCRALILHRPVIIPAPVPVPVSVPMMPVCAPPNLPPMIGCQPPPLPKPNAVTQGSNIPKLEKIDLSKIDGPFDNHNYRKFAISPFVHQECRLSDNDYNWLKNKEVLEYLLEYGTSTHLNEVMMSHLAHSSNMLYKRIVKQIHESFQTAFKETLLHLFQCVRLILGIVEVGNGTHIITTLPDKDVTERCIHKILPKLITNATSQEKKYSVDAQVLMDFAKELITAKKYSFAFELACKDQMCDLIIKNLFDKNKPIVRLRAMQIMEYIIDTIHGQRMNNSLRMTQCEKIIELILEKLSVAKEIAANQSLIDNSNDSFPDDLKNYLERKPKINMYISIVDKLMNLYPEKVVPRLVQKENWTILCEIVHELESGADTFSWAKNDDKLCVLRIMITLIEKYKVNTDTLFSMKLITALTSQYLVSTRSNTVSQHMAEVVSITYKLLTVFARDPDEIESKSNTAESEEKKTDVIIDESKRWVQKKIVDEHWFLWAISDIVTPNNVYQSSVAAHSIIRFIQTIVGYKCMENATAKMIKKCMKKWEDSSTTCNTNKKMTQYPRETVLQLLVLLLRTEKDHSLFIENGGHKLINVWLKNFFFTDILKGNDEISTYNSALDFFKFHIACISLYPQLQNDKFLPFIGHYFEAVCSIFAYNSHQKHNPDWANLFKKALSLLQLIFDLEKVYPNQNNNRIVEYFVKHLALSQILTFSVQERDYNQSKNNTEVEEKMITYLTKIRENCHDPQLMATQLRNPCSFFAKTKQLFSDKVTRLLQLFLDNYAKCDKFKYSIPFLSPVMLSCWVLKVQKCQFPDIIEQHIQSYLNYICERDKEFQAMASAWTTLIVFMTCSLTSNDMFLDALNLKLFVSLTKAVINAILDQKENANSNHKSMLLRQLRKLTLLKYLPGKCEICVNEMQSILNAPVLVNESKIKTGSDMKDESEKEFKDENNNENSKYILIQNKCFGFIRYYYYVLAETDIIISISVSDKKDDNYGKLKFPKTNANVKWWTDLRNKMLQIIKIINDDITTANKSEWIGVKREIIKYLTKISAVIEGKLKDCAQKMQELIATAAEQQKSKEESDVAMCDKSNKSTSQPKKTVSKIVSKTVNKKQKNKKCLAIKLKEKMSKEIPKKTKPSQSEPMQIESQSTEQQSNSEQTQDTMAVDSNNVSDQAQLH